MTEFRTRKDGKVYPKGVAKFKGMAKKITQTDLKKVHIHALSIAGYALDLADDLRKRALEKAVTMYGKGDTMAELAILRKKYDNSERMKRVIDSDISYVANGKFEED
jgi:hypothetical protein